MVRAPVADVPPGKPKRCARDAQISSIHPAPAAARRRPGAVACRPVSRRGTRWRLRRGPRGPGCRGTAFAGRARQAGERCRRHAAWRSQGVWAACTLDGRAARSRAGALALFFPFSSRPPGLDRFSHRPRPQHPCSQPCGGPRALAAAVLALSHRTPPSAPAGEDRDQVQGGQGARRHGGWQGQEEGACRSPAAAALRGRGGRDDAVVVGRHRRCAARGGRGSGGADPAAAPGDTEAQQLCCRGRRR
jgi:hypothetical protein